MNIDDIKKGLECCSNPSINPCKDCPYNKNGDFSYCNDKILKDTLNLITEQEKEIGELKDDYAKLQELFAQYQMASDKEIRAQIKQAKIDVLNRLKSLSIYDDNYLDGYVFIDDIDKLLEEYRK